MHTNPGNRKMNSPSDVGKILTLQRVFISAASIAAVLAVTILIISLVRFIKVAGANAVTEETTLVPIVSTDATTSTEVIMNTELLPDNELADQYWGELEELPLSEVKEITHNEIRGLYVGSGSSLDLAIERCNNSELNAIVIDLKNEWGCPFMCENETANQIGYVWDAYDLAEVVEKCHENGIYVIGRIVCFNDCTAAEKFPERAICDINGNPLHFKTEGKRPFLSPYNKDNWEYLISLAEEACGYGVDEIQFDYVRFPAGSTSEGVDPYYGPEGSTPSKADAINRFLQEARIRIQDKLGVPLSADIFGIVLTSPMDAEIIGQDFATLGMTGIDSCCPMVYPSHYALGTMLNGFTFEYPDKEPYLIVYSVLQESQDIFSQEGFSTVRPYLQAFTASYIGEGNYIEYGYDEINAQIKALHDLGIQEYILWDPKVKYPEGPYDGNMAVPEN